MFGYVIVNMNKVYTRFFVKVGFICLNQGAT